MYAVVMTGGRQYRVEAGSTLVVEKVAGEPGSSVTFDRVLLIGDGESVTIGTPTVPGASVSATVLGEALGPKIVVFKFKQKVKYRRRTGHRQHLTRLLIDSISADGKTVRAEHEETPIRAAAAARKPAKKRVEAKVNSSEGAQKEAAKGKARRSTTRAQPATAQPAETAEANKPVRTKRTRTASAKAAEAAAPSPSASISRPKTRSTTKPKSKSAEEE